jgi:hypothetical protein
MQVNSLFKRDSQELRDYLEDNKVGKQVTASDGKRVWTVKKIQQFDDLPPDPNVGPVVKVTVTMTDF